jgi:hypothetical protein
VSIRESGCAASSRCATRRRTAARAVSSFAAPVGRCADRRVASAQNQPSANATSAAQSTL